MGEVYRARDTKLGREVAIKVLPDEVGAHPDKLARFEREARLLAALKHPGIATLHGLEEAAGKPFLVMELVEGETLAERITRGPVPVEEALPIARQIAEAVEAAHESDIVHRDLKPAKSCWSANRFLEIPLDSFRRPPVEARALHARRRPPRSRFTPHRPHVSRRLQTRPWVVRALPATLTARKSRRLCSSHGTRSRAAHDPR